MIIKKTLSALEYPSVLKMLQGHASNPVSQTAAHSLLPTTNYQTAQILAKQTHEAMLMQGNFPQTESLSDIRSTISRADKGAVLSISEILSVGNLLAICRSFSKFFFDVKEDSPLFEFSSQIQPKNALENDISSAIVSPEDISDNASTELANIRRAQRRNHEKIKQSLESLIRNQNTQKHLQEAIITMRNNRYVLPVKAESKQFVKGITHDSSGTGSTLFIEPLSVVEINNEISKLKSQEEDEIRRILAEFSTRIADDKDALLTNFYAVSSLDFIFVKARFAHAINAHIPTLNNNGFLHVKKARHPLIDPANVVPIEIKIGNDVRTIIITGPNTGGKTVALKTVGLLSLMAASGLAIPASNDSEVPIWTGVHADIGDEQSIEQNLSTFSSHMANIVNIIKYVRPNSLVLFDELGAGTDPDEGAALAVAILEQTKERGALSLATTHYSQLKLYASSELGVQNASCEFDINTLKPTYKLLVGVPGKSNAFAISRRLGLSDRIIENAKNQLTHVNIKFEDAVRNLHEKTQKLTELSEAKEEGARAIESKKLELEKLEAKYAEKMQRAQADAKKIINEAKKEAEKVIRELKKSQKSEIDKKAIEARTRLNKQYTEKVANVLQIPDSLIAPNRVTFTPMNKKSKQPKTNLSKLKTASVSTEIDLRGQFLEDAVLASELFIDSAVVNGLSTVSIIHGKGTGALRTGVHKMLKNNPNVVSFRLGTYGEGEDGITIVELKTV